MSRRSGGHNPGGVGLFPFLAVLLCTMGGLLVLLVVMAEQARKSALAEQAAAADLPTDHELVESLLRQLEAAQSMLAQAESLLAEAEERLEHEQARLTHSEEHQRRLEKELAELSLAARQLEQTEDEASVDQQQAEAERDRLRDILAETEAQLEELREQGVGEKAFAIVPYTGPNGTRRQPIYVECLERELVIHPEGVRVTAMDLVDPQWPGNPLAAALRASRELLNRRAREAGLPEPPDPYPLLIVRPQGNRMYHQARIAIQSWDSDYGYEFVEQDRKLVYPIEPDVGLAQAQQHAVINARERLESRINAAPSRYRNHLAARAAVNSLGGVVDASPASLGSTGGNGSLPAGDPFGEASHVTGDTRESRYGQVVDRQGSAEDGEGGDGSGSPGGASSDEYAVTDLQHSNASDHSVAAQPYADDPGMAGRAPGGSASGTQSSTAGVGTQQASGGGQGQSEAMAAAATPTTSHLSLNAPPVDAQSPDKRPPTEQGENRPDRRRRGATPIQRVIRFVIDGDRAIAAPEREGVDDSEVLSVRGADKQVADRFRGWIDGRVEGWGLAGHSLYWKPVVVLEVLPEGQHHAARLAKLIEYHGFEVQVDRTAQRREASDAARR